MSQQPQRPGTTRSSRWHCFLLWSSLVVTGLPAAAELPDDYVRYRQVTWKDFRGGSAELAPAMAGIRTGINMDFRLKVTRIRGRFWKATAASSEVFAYMDRGASAFRPGTNTVRLLEHEQLHFDITESYARELSTELDNFELVGIDSAPVRSNAAARLDAIYERISRECDETHKRYDQQTHNGLLEAEQRRWEKEIQGRLARH